MSDNTNIKFELDSKQTEAFIKWREKYKPSCPESLVQMDRVNEALPELAEAIFQVIGYHEEDE